MVFRTEFESITICCHRPDRSVPVKGTLLIVEDQTPAPLTMLQDTPSALLGSIRQKSSFVSSFPSRIIALPVLLENTQLEILLMAEISLWPQFVPFAARPLQSIRPPFIRERLIDAPENPTTAAMEAVAFRTVPCSSHSSPLETMLSWELIGYESALMNVLPPAARAGFMTVAASLFIMSVPTWPSEPLAAAWYF